MRHSKAEQRLRKLIFWQPVTSLLEPPVPAKALPLKSDVPLPQPMFRARPYRLPPSVAQRREEADRPL